MKYDNRLRLISGVHSIELRAGRGGSPVECFINSFSSRCWEDVAHRAGKCPGDGVLNAVVSEYCLL